MPDWVGTRDQIADYGNGDAAHIIVDIILARFQS